MTISNVTPISSVGEYSRIVGQELRAEMARRNVNQSELARRMNKPQPWVSRRIGAGATTDITFEEAAEMAKALGLSPQGLLSVLLPRLDSNQQPSGYTSSQVSAPVVDLFTRDRVA